MTVHVLNHGHALCGFGGLVVPGLWPEGHRWVGLEDAFAEAADCPGCLECCDVLNRVLRAPSPQQKAVQDIINWLTRYAASLDAQAVEHETKTNQIVAAEDRLIAAVYRCVAQQIAGGEWKP